MINTSHYNLTKHHIYLFSVTNLYMISQITRYNIAHISSMSPILVITNQLHKIKKCTYLYLQTKYRTGRAKEKWVGNVGKKKDTCDDYKICKNKD